MTVNFNQFEDVLYHGTPAENVEKVMRRGLRPSRPIMGYHTEDEQEFEGTGQYNERYPRGVYLTPDLEHAKAFGGAVFSVDPNKLRGDWLASDDDMAEVYSKRIPARLLKRVE